MRFGIFSQVVFFFPKIFRNGENRHNRVRVEIEQLNLIHNFLRIGKGFRNIAKQLIHFGRGFKPLLLGIAHSGGVVQIFSGIQTNQQIVRVSIFLVYEVRVVGTNNFYIVFLCQIQNFGVYQYLIVVNILPKFGRCCRVSLQFEVIILTKNRLEPLNCILCIIDVIGHDVLRNFTSQTRRRHYQALAVLFQNFLVDTRFIIKPFGICQRNQFQQVAVTYLVFGQQNEVITRAVDFRILFVMARLFGNVRFAADNRFKAFLFTNIIEFFRAKHVTMIGQRQRCHSIFLSLCDQPFYAGSSIQNGIL